MNLIGAGGGCRFERRIVSAVGFEKRFGVAARGAAREECDDTIAQE